MQPLFFSPHHMQKLSMSSDAEMCKEYFITSLIAQDDNFHFRQITLIAIIFHKIELCSVLFKIAQCRKRDKLVKFMKSFSLLLEIMNENDFN